MSINLTSLQIPRPRRRTTHNGLSTRDSAVDNRISAKRCKNVAALILETLRNHGRPSDSLRSQTASISSIAHVRTPTHDQTFARGSAKSADLGLGVQPPTVGSRGMPKSVHSPDNDSKERADDIKALTISEVNC